jgi:hypothetical protein
MVGLVASSNLVVCRFVQETECFTQPSLDSVHDFLVYDKTL